MYHYIIFIKNNCVHNFNKSWMILYQIALKIEMWKKNSFFVENVFFSEKMSSLEDIIEEFMAEQQNLCYLCNEVFEVAANIYECCSITFDFQCLKKHCQLYHHNGLYCQSCSLYISKAKIIKLFKKKAKTFSCELCGYITKRKYNLERHILKQHWF